MKTENIFITNSRHFREIFESDTEASLIEDNLKKAIQKDLMSDKTAHIDLEYWVHYDEEGLAGFEITQAKFSHDKAYLNVNFISTAK